MKLLFPLIEQYRYVTYVPCIGLTHEREWPYRMILKISLIILKSMVFQNIENLSGLILDQAK